MIEDIRHAIGDDGFSFLTADNYLKASEVHTNKLA